MNRTRAPRSWSPARATSSTPPRLTFAIVAWHAEPTLTPHLAFSSLFASVAASANGASEPPAGGNLEILPLILGASGVVMLVLFLLILLSIAGWYVIGYKYLYLRRAERESLAFLDRFWQSKRLDSAFKAAEDLSHSPIAAMYKAAYVELAKLQTLKEQGETASLDEHFENVERALRRAATSETTHLESLVPLLATVGSSAPFIGLFGTVWGIMNSFRSIGARGSANLATVAPGIAEALIATAIGLVAAIPAVMAYNYFARKIRVLSSEMETFSSDFLNLVKRHFL